MILHEDGGSGKSIAGFTYFLLFRRCHSFITPLPNPQIMLETGSDNATITNRLNKDLILSPGRNSLHNNHYQLPPFSPGWPVLDLLETPLSPLAEAPHNPYKVACYL